MATETVEEMAQRIAERAVAELDAERASGKPSTPVEDPETVRMQSELAAVQGKVQREHDLYVKTLERIAREARERNIATPPPEAVPPAPPPEVRRREALRAEVVRRMPYEGVGAQPFERDIAGKIAGEIAAGRDPSSVVMAAGLPPGERMCLGLIARELHQRERAAKGGK